MNSLKSVQRRFVEQGEVEFRHGAKAVFWTLTMPPLAALCFWTVSIYIQEFVRGNFSRGDAAAAIGMSILLLTGGVMFLIGFVLMCLPSYHRNHRLRVTRAGVQMSGLRVPWQSVLGIEKYTVDPRGVVRHVRLRLLPTSAAEQVVWHDGSAVGQKLADAGNSSRELILFTSNLNVRPRTLRTFLKWVYEQECPAQHEFNFQTEGAHR